ncbi:MAG: cytochrome c biogenesis protein CcdA [Ruminococcaceae bacterium]|nr:cytochrome c biogenesis protein CcdA [Oscillospiraceae bacterium]
MQYLITFLEGVITFISPCLLPMLPIYLIYFAAGSKEASKKQSLFNAFAFIAGFSLLFVSLGALAGTLGVFLTKNQTLFNIICGIILIIFGINYTGLIKLPFLNSTKKFSLDIKPTGFISSFLFGLVFAFGYSPCIGAFLSSALLMAANSKTALEGILLLLLYSLGLGLPFLICTLIIDNLKGAIGFIKSHYNIINPICGILLILIGILMATGILNKILYIFSV